LDLSESAGGLLWVDWVGVTLSYIVQS